MAFVKATDITGLDVGKTKKVIINGNEILFSNVDGTYYAISNKCTHMGGSLAEGTLVEGIITCPRHGAKFDVKTGKAVGNAKLLFVKMAVKDEQSYAVKNEGEGLFLEMDY